MAGNKWEYALHPCSGPECAETLSLIGAASFLENFAGFLPGEDVLAHCRNQHSRAKYESWLAASETRACLAEVRGAPVGYALLCAPDLPVRTTPDDIELKRIYLLHRFQGSGVGAALMDWSIGTARALGKRRLILGVHEGNEKALAFYRQHGFTDAGTRSFQVGQTICSDLILALAVSAR
ncbi:MAG TPA: GNAT family N-acetyltransferase [Acidobacteriaceae bacterium]|nr:GNAT family N-acetyltransferase [Acidobacteriaceae bacterium]